MAQFVAGYQVGKVAVQPGLVLAPMSGVTTCSFRRLIRRLNPGAVGLTVSEFVSVEGMTRLAPRTLAMMRKDADEKPYCIQIFGYDLTRMSEAARMVQDAGADIIDINCGCPAPKVVRKGGGCELMRQPDHLKQIVAAVRKAVTIPVTLKMRSGWDENSRNAIEVARIIESEGIDAIAVHGRTRTQLYRGLADWSVVEAVADAVKVPVLGSGDVVDRESAIARMGGGKVSGLLIARAALWNPYVFSEVLGFATPKLFGEDVLLAEILEQYTQYLLDEFTPQTAVGKIKQLASQMCRGVAWRKELLGLSTIEAQADLLIRVKDGAWSRVDRAPLAEMMAAVEHEELSAAH
jgi:tRNA-dihydrouridine synthase B